MLNVRIPHSPPAFDSFADCLAYFEEVATLSELSSSQTAHPTEKSRIHIQVNGDCFLFAFVPTVFSNKSARHSTYRPTSVNIMDFLLRRSAN